MSFAAGTHLGPYEIVSLIGSGGMGEVYRALDPRLGREVAIKVSADQFTERFEREARAVAALNHPNICHVYDVGPNYLVMELVEGESPKGPLPLETVLKYARQIADALEAAHHKGIVHRDLKPGNIKITPDGTVKVLDFGLAKVAASSVSNSENSPTLSLAATNAGVILGTAAYMSPEQARGEPVDAQADIWAFGVVLYEMLTGARAFEGRTLSDTLAAVLIKEPDLDRVPLQLRPLLRRCLAKDPKQRLHHAADVRLLLDELPITDTALTPPELPPRRRAWIPILAAAVFAVPLAVLAFIHYSERPPESPVVRFQIPPPGKTDFSNPTVSVSPDGKYVAFIANGPSGTNQLWVRSLDSLEARPLPGADAALPGFFWSPDSRSIGYPTYFNKLRRVDVYGGPPQTVTDLPAPFRGGAWARNEPGKGVIVFAVQGRGLIETPEAGGPAKALTMRKADGEIDPGIGIPVFLPDQQHFLYYRFATNRENGIYLGSLEANPDQQSSKRLIAASDPGLAYAPSVNSSMGRILFTREGTLMAQRFDTKRLELVGDATPITEGVLRGSVSTFSVSATGVLAYMTGLTQGRQLTWFDRSGKALATSGDPGDYNTVSLSPDGNRVAVSRIDAGSTDLWIHEFAQGSTTRLTFDSTNSMAAWSPDGTQIIFSSIRDGAALVRKASSGAGAEEAILKTDVLTFVQDWSSDAHFLLYSVQAPGGNFDLWMFPLEGDRKPQKYLATEFNESQARFSPDGRYVAYSSNNSGRNEIYVQPFPNAAEGKWVVSVEGGSAPRWRRDGKELFYISTDSKLVAVEVSTDPVFTKKGVPKALFSVPIYGGGGTTNVIRYDVSPDGQKFLINAERSPANSADVNPITVILNWPALLKR
jgi:serine/threonine protein kinase/WD40 repeat protein